MNDMCSYRSHLVWKEVGCVDNMSSSDDSELLDVAGTVYGKLIKDSLTQLTPLVSYITSCCYYCFVIVIGMVIGP